MQQSCRRDRWTCDGSRVLAARVTGLRWGAITPRSDASRAEAQRHGYGWMSHGVLLSCPELTGPANHARTRVPVQASAWIAFRLEAPRLVLRQAAGCLRCFGNLIAPPLQHGPRKRRLVTNVEGSRATCGRRRSSTEQGACPGNWSEMLAPAVSAPSARCPDGASPHTPASRKDQPGNSVVPKFSQIGENPRSSAMMWSWPSSEVRRAHSDIDRLALMR